MFNKHICFLHLTFSLLVTTSCIPVMQKKVSELIFKDQTKNKKRRPAQVLSFLDSGSLKLRGGDRIFVSNFLKDIFGPSSYSIINDKVLKNQKVFGGICDINDNARNCDLLRSNTTISDFGTVRSGAMTKACELIVKSNASISYALAQNNIGINDELTKEALTLQYQIFYPFKDMPTLFRDHLMTYKDALDNPVEAWRIVHLTICLSSEWQIP